MRTTTVLALGVLAAGVLGPGSGIAQQTPTAAQIVKSLTSVQPVGPTTRGIRAVMPQSGTAEPARAAAPAPSVSLNIDFASGSAQLTPQARQALDQLGQALIQPQLARYEFRIEGHTDTVGSAASNQILSERRAAIVVGYLEGRFNIDPSRLRAVGMGERGLLVPTPGDTPEQRNRRVLVINTGT